MTMRVSLASPHAAARTTYARNPPRALAHRGGARVILGAECAMHSPVTPVAPTARALFGPRGVSLAPNGGPLVVCDTGHHRLLIWKRLPPADGTPADLVIGQPGFTTESRNAGGETGAATLNVPSGIAMENGVIALADAWNHRVLLWFDVPTKFNQPADVVLGQNDFRCGLANRGRSEPAADTLNWCYGVALHGKRLYIADTGNRRVLVWNSLPKSHGAPADLVLGQRHFECRDTDAISEAAGMRWPHGVAAHDAGLFVADAGKSRVMVWTSLPRQNGAACDFVLGQPDFFGANHNRGEYLPTAATLNMPYGITADRRQLAIADTANSRLVGYDLGEITMNAAATALAAQPDFETKGDNRWKAPTRDSVCWPYGIAAMDNTLAIADTGNNRILLWERT